MALKLTLEEIEAAKSPKGGWTAKTLAGWGVSWPPPHGWKDALLKGEPIPEAGVATSTAKPSRSPDPGETDYKALFQKVVMAAINTGNGHIFTEIPEVVAYYGGEIPTVESIVGGRPEGALLTGGLEWDDKVYSFSVARRTR